MRVSWEMFGPNGLVIQNRPRRLVSALTTAHPEPTTAQIVAGLVCAPARMS